VREDAPQRQASGFRAPPVRVTMGHLKELVARRAAGERLTVEEERDLEAGSSALKGFSESIAGAFPSLLSPARETRSREEYEAQVKDYLAKCSRLLPAVLRSTAGERLPACVFEIVNDTDRNFPAVQVEVYVPGDVEAVRARQRASNEGRLPRPPLAYGTRQEYWWAGLEFGDPLTRSPGLRASDLGVARPSAQPSGPAVSIENGGSARLRFSPVDIRPQHAVRLPPVVLLPQQPQDPTVVMAWSATSTGAPGVVRGELVVPVCGEVWSIREAAGISGD
jgi:hypothetical protein